jgi:hypothetical protein
MMLLLHSTFDHIWAELKDPVDEVLGALPARLRPGPKFKILRAIIGADPVAVVHVLEAI